MVDDEVTLSVEAVISRMKLETIEKGDVTDFSFLVGQDGETELMHCFKSDLLVASEYFRALLRNTQAGSLPVRIKHVKPHIFKMILRFISLHKIGEISNIEDALAFTLAADEFLLEPLRHLCYCLIEKFTTVRNVWHVLNSTVNISQIPAACKLILTFKTEECLAHSTFLEASQESLIFLLQQELLNIDSEQDLIDACLKLSRTKPADVESELLRAAMPHLRLLTLKGTKIKPALLNCLTDSEKLCLLSRLYYGKSIEEGEVHLILNLNSSPRGKPKKPEVPKVLVVPSSPPIKHIVEIIPKNMIYIDSSELSKDKFDKLMVCNSSIELKFCTKCDVSLCGIDVLAPLQDKAKTPFDEHSGNSILSPTVEVVLDFPGKKVLYAEEVKFNHSLFSTIDLRFSSEIVIPKGVSFRIKVLYPKKLMFQALCYESCCLLLSRAKKHPLISEVGLYEPQKCRYFAMCKDECFNIKNVHIKAIKY